MMRRNVGVPVEFMESQLEPISFYEILDKKQQQSVANIPKLIDVIHDIGPRTP